MLTLLVVLSLAQSKPVEVIRGGAPAKVRRAAPAKDPGAAIPVAQETPPPPSQRCASDGEAAKALEAKAKALEERAAELRAKEEALADEQQKASRDAQARQRQREQLERHGAGLREQYRKAANALAGE